jgi:tetratricopeptide (TPR) repeat protein
MPRIPNPYIAGPPVSGPNFYGRENIFRFVQDTFSSPRQNVVVLWGQRRMGKTSVLHELSSRLSPEFHPIYFDLQDKAQQKLNEVLYDLAREIAGSLNLDPPPRDDFLCDDDYFHERFLPQVYQHLGPKRLLFMFDEFDVLEKPKEELAHDVAVRAFFPYLRRTLIYDKQLTFVFVVGRRLDELDELLQSTFKMAKTASISFLEEEEARQLIVEPASDALEYKEEAVERIASITACYPYLTQLICSELFSHMEAAGRTRVTVSDAEAVVDKAIAAGSAGLTWLWGGLPPAERFVLSAVAYASREGRVATEDEISRILEEYQVPFLGPELTQAPDNLTRWGLLRRTANGYEFVVELLQYWILREHSLEQAKRELELASPRAARLYELASEAHQANELVTAIRFYRDALAANPNHLQAQLRLAQALFEQGRLEEAITEYERAYSFDRARARDGLIEARQAWAEALEKGGRVNEADQEYETILGIRSESQRMGG